MLLRSYTTPPSIAYEHGLDGLGLHGNDKVPPPPCVVAFLCLGHTDHCKAQCPLDTGPLDSQLSKYSPVPYIILRIREYVDFPELLGNLTESPSPFRHYVLPYSSSQTALSATATYCTLPRKQQCWRYECEA